MKNAIKTGKIEKQKVNEVEKISIISNAETLESNLKNFDSKQFSVEELKSSGAQHRIFKQFSKYPFIEKDVSFIVDNEVLSGDLEDAIYKYGQPLITGVEIFDLYAGEKLDADKKSIAFRMRFQSPDRTLQDKEVNALFEKTISHITRKFPATLRDE